MRIRVMPLHRKSTKVAMKLMAPIRDAPQKIADIEDPQVLSHALAGTGEATQRRLEGGYAVQPESGALPCTKNAATMTTRARKVVQNDIMFNTGNAMPSALI